MRKEKQRKVYYGKVAIYPDSPCSSPLKWVRISKFDYDNPGLSDRILYDVDVIINLTPLTL